METPLVRFSCRQQLNRELGHHAGIRGDEGSGGRAGWQGRPSATAVPKLRNRCGDGADDFPGAVQDVSRQS